MGDIDDDLLNDFHILGLKLVGAEDSGAAAIVRERRLISGVVDIPSHAVELRSDYDSLGQKMPEASDAGAAAIARERRAIRNILLDLEPKKEPNYADELAIRRKRSGDTRLPARRRYIGRGPRSD